MLVRSPDRVSVALDPLGVDPAAVEVVAADITDRCAVNGGVDGMDAIVHAASVYSFDPRRALEIERTNSLGLPTVMEASISAGLDPIVHVSSFVALLRDNVVDDVLTPDSPPGDPSMAYPASKARQETYVRELQARGGPVVIIYPGGVYGPDDPHDGESVQAVQGWVATTRRCATWSLTWPGSPADGSRRLQHRLE
jgi:nucleoside-diphosphate-sugar epimerase